MAGINLCLAEEIFRRSAQSPLFGYGNGFECTTVVIIVAIADFNYRQAGFFQHDQVEFPVRATVVLLDENEASGLQPFAGSLFAICAP